MDIQFLEGNNFKIKSKLVSISTSPLSIGEKIIYGPGEYEIGGVSVMGFGTKDKNVVYLIEADKLNILYLGEFGGKLEGSLIDELGEVDIVLAVSKNAITEGMRLDPYYIITSSVDNFKDFGIQPEETPKFSIKKEDIIEDQNTKGIVLTRK